MAAVADPIRCPRCGSTNLEQPEHGGSATSSAHAADGTAADRIQDLVAARWARGLGLCGPDGRWLRTCFLSWLGIVGVAWAWPGPSAMDPWQAGGLLIAVVLLGTWADRRAARTRGWIDAMARAEQIVSETRERVARLDAAGECTCRQCGCRFESASALIAST